MNKIEDTSTYWRTYNPIKYILRIHRAKIFLYFYKYNNFYHMYIF